MRNLGRGVQDARADWDGMVAVGRRSGRAGRLVRAGTPVGEGTVGPRSVICSWSPAWSLLPVQDCIFLVSDSAPFSFPRRIHDRVAPVS